MGKKTIVFGATGKTGVQICNELKSNNIEHTMFVREESVEKVKGSSAPIKKGNVINYDDVNKAFQDCNYTDVIIALGTKNLKDSTSRTIGTKNILKAMTENKSEARLHVISALGIGESWNQLKWLAKLFSNVLINNTMNDHREQEKAVLDSPFSYHIIRPVGLKEGESKGEVHVQNEGFIPSNAIQIIDVAKFLVKSLIENKNGISGICQKVN